MHISTFMVNKDEYIRATERSFNRTIIAVLCDKKMFDICSKTAVQSLTRIQQQQESLANASVKRATAVHV